MTDPEKKSTDGEMPTLVGDERNIVDRHKSRIKQLTKDLTALVRKQREWNRDCIVGEDRYPPTGFKQPRMATTLAVLGRRGSGKSTCIVALIGELARDSGIERVRVGKRKLDCLNGFVVAHQTVDCTLGPREVPLGLSALMRLRRVLGLKDDPPADWSCEGKDLSTPGVEDEKKAFKAMREAYMLSRRAAGRVFEGTSSSGAHFSRQASKAAADALALPDLVADWLQQAALRLGPEVEGFILVLDDVDLARDRLRGLVNSLLDELHQPRLLLVLGADLPRLERRVADSVAEDPVELAAARDLLYKALPQQNREWLEPWGEKERWAFPPPPAPTFPSNENLKYLLLQHTEEWGVAVRNPALLPEFPRALENLWFALRGLDQGTEAEAESGTRKMLDTVDAYLAFLGEARGEHDLGRRISSRSVSAWARHLIWSEQPIGNSQWERMVNSALEGAPLLGFQVRLDDLPLPLDPSSTALWIELLLDLSLASGQLTASELIRRFPRMNDLAGDAQIHTDFHREEMADQLRQARGSVMAKLAWTRFDVALEKHGVLSEEFDAQVGLVQLNRAIEGRRNAWPAILAQGLYLQRSDVLNDRQRAYATDGPPDDAEAMLPRGVRPLIVFVDSLANAPWQLLSETPRRRSLRTNALLAAGLMYAVYVDALERVFNALEERKDVAPVAGHTLSDADRGWLNAMHDREDSHSDSPSVPIVEWSDREVENHFHALLEETKDSENFNCHQELVEEDLHEQHITHAEGSEGSTTDIDWEFIFSPYNTLVACLDAYTKSHAFKDLADPSRTQVD